jgi:hypothetical protein
VLAADLKSKFCADLDLARVPLAHLAGAAVVNASLTGIVGIVDNGVVDSVESITRKRKSLNNFLPMTLSSAARNVSVLLSVEKARSGRFEIADAEVVAIVLAARVFHLS